MPRARCTKSPAGTTTTENTMNTCICGTTEPHVIARRMTADRIGVALWQDGAITGRFATGFPGVPIVRPRTSEARNLALRAGWLFMGEVEVHETDNLGDLYAACRWAAARDGLPGTVRARLAEIAKPGDLVPVWETVSVDRDGKVTSRYWRLPRMISAGTVVWDHVSVGASGGRYEIHHVVPGSKGETVVPTGIRFTTLAAVSGFITLAGDAS
jgi:hypothetical protein